MAEPKLRVPGRVDERGNVSQEYTAYANAKARCRNPKHPRWRWYGARGIEFKFEGFEQFLNEVGRCPVGKVLDRTDNSLHYEPGNVRWVNRKQSARNRRPPLNRWGFRFMEVRAKMNSPQTTPTELLEISEDMIFKMFGVTSPEQPANFAGQR